MNRIGHLGWAEFRHNDDGSIDEIVARRVNVHVEQMSDECFWMGLSRGDDLVHVNFWTPRTRIRVNYNAEMVESDDRAEAGEFSSGLVLPPWMKGAALPKEQRE